MDHQSAVRCGIAWHPDGTLLAVPGVEHDVVCYDRDDWKPVSYLTGHHTAYVNLVTYSPNGGPSTLCPNPYEPGPAVPSFFSPGGCDRFYNLCSKLICGSIPVRARGEWQSTANPTSAGAGRIFLHSPAPFRASSPKA